MFAIRLPVLALLVLAFAACGGGSSPSTPGTGADAAVCAKPCGTECCTGDLVCNPATTKCERACVPSCSGKACGSDGCGGTCGTCPGNAPCRADGTCGACQPQCIGKECGSDGCGGNCGMCFAGTACDPSGKCVACTPDCNGKTCGSDGCGGSCGTCTGSDTCSSAGTCVAPTDGGTVDDDASIPADASTVPPDAGTVPPDAGTIPPDAGTIAPDAATLPPDAGLIPPDAGLIPPDAGVVPPDAGTPPSDAGTSPPANDSCATAETLTFVNDVATAHPDTTLAANDYQGTCGGSGRDVVYAIQLSAPKLVNVKLTPKSGQTPAVYVRKGSACTSTASADEVGCGTGSGTANDPASLAFTGQVGTYYVIVDAISSGFGASDLTVTLTTPQTGDTCASPLPLTFTNNVATATGDLDKFANDTNSVNCGGSISPDAVYTFTLTAPKSITAKVTADATSTGFNPVVYLRSVCDSTAFSDERICQYASADVAAVSDVLPAGTWYVWVDGFSGTKGKYTLEVTQATPPPPPANDACSTATTLTFTNDAASATGDTTSATNDTAGSCGGGSAGDVVYSFTLTAKKRVTATATSTGGLTPLMYFRSSCADTTAAAEGGCSAGSGTSGTVTATLAAGTWYLWVDGSPGTKGPYSLNVTLADPPLTPTNDDCTGIQTLSFNASGVATATGDTTSANNTTNSYGCGGYGNDVVYTFTTTATKDLDVTLTPKPGNTAYNPVVYVRKASCGSTTSTDELGCEAAPAGGTAAKLSLAAVPAGTYYLWVDGYSGTQGAWDLTVTATTPPPPPANDTCSAPTPITLTTGSTTTVMGDASGGANDASGSCGGTSSADVVYSFTLTSDQKITATVTPDASATAFSPLLYLRGTSCSATTDERACASGFSSATVTVNYLAAGTYYLWVDGGRGKFTLSVTPSASVPPKATDTCDVPGTLSLTSGQTTSITGSTTALQGDTTSSCGGAGPDGVYTFTTTSAAQFTATVTPSATSTSYEPMVYLRRACRSALSTDEVVCASPPGAGNPATITVASLPAGTWYLWVDGFGGTLGDFKLDATLTPPATPPSNDRCNAPTVLSLNSTVSGTTVGATNDFGAGPFATACTGQTSAPVNGPDVVYSFTPGTTGTVTVTLTPTTSTFDPVLWVTSGTCGGTGSACVAAADAARAGLPETLSLNVTAGTTYYFVVDSYGTNTGAFSLVVQ